MKRFVMAAGIAFLISATAWAQSDPVVTAKEKTDETVSKLLENARGAVRLRIQGTPNVAPAIQNSLTVQRLAAPFSIVNGQNGFQLVSPSTTDPLTALQVAPGTWWNNMDTVTRLNLTKDQQKKMDDIFQQFRLKLIDLNAALSKEELIMDPLIASEKLDEAKILTQIDHIAEARAELEKANSRMLLGIRQSLTMEQWTKIQASPGSFRTPALRR